MRRAIEAIGETEQGVVVLHHAILAWMGWHTWSDIIGLHDRSFDSFDYYLDQELRTEVADADHAITMELPDFDIHDETYVMADADPAAGNRALLTTHHSLSMQTLGWARQHNRSRVFCYQAGHDKQAYENSHFRAVLRRGIQWCAGRI